MNLHALRGASWRYNPKTIHAEMRECCMISPAHGPDIGLRVMRSAELYTHPEMRHRTYRCGSWIQPTPRHLHIPRRAYATKAPRYHTIGLRIAR